MKKEKIILYDDWFDKYKPIKNKLINDAPFNGRMFETFGVEDAFVLNYEKNNRIWTMVEGDEGKLTIIPNYHIVNRFGYFITKKKWKKKHQDKLIIDVDD